MFRFLRRHSLTLLGIVVALGFLIVPMLFFEQLLAVPADPEAAGFWMRISKDAREFYLTAYYTIVAVVVGWVLLNALRVLRVRRSIQAYEIYGEKQGEIGKITVPSTGGGTTVFEVLDPDLVYSRFPKKYGRLKLIDLFKKVYPVAILAENLSLGREDMECALLHHPTTLRPKEFQLSGVAAACAFELQKVHEVLRGKDFAWFDDLARLQSYVLKSRLLRSGARLKLRFEVCNYLDYVLTNYSADLARPGDRAVRDYLDGWPARRRGLSSLSSSICANQLGLNAMIATRDGKMIAAHRSDELFTFPGLWAPPVSGTQMYWYKEDRYRDMPDGSRILLREAGPATDYYSGYVGEHGIPNPFDGVMAQAKEEINLDRDHIRGVKFIGLNRDLTRGGIPDAFFVIHLKITVAELWDNGPEDARDSWEWNRDGEGLPEFGPYDLRTCTYQDAKAGLREWLDSHPATPALVSGIYFFLQYLKRHEPEFTY